MRRRRQRVKHKSSYFQLQNRILEPWQALASQAASQLFRCRCARRRLDLMPQFAERRPVGRRQRGQRVRDFLDFRRQLGANGIARGRGSEALLRSARPATPSKGLERSHRFINGRNARDLGSGGGHRQWRRRLPGSSCPGTTMMRADYLSGRLRTAHDSPADTQALTLHGSRSWRPSSTVPNCRFRMALLNYAFIRDEQASYSGVAGGHLRH